MSMSFGAFLSKFQITSDSFFTLTSNSSPFKGEESYLLPSPLAGLSLPRSFHFASNPYRMRVARDIGFNITPIPVSFFLDKPCVDSYHFVK